MTTTHFDHSDFACSCCGSNKISGRLVELLQAIRSIVNFPIIVNSGYRCKYHPESVKNPTSSHIKGLAVDIHFNDNNEKFAIIKAAISIGVCRIGVYDNFIHLDIDSDKNQNIMW